MSRSGIELRSDTFTLPTTSMREAACTAELGDDVWGEDPTVTALERQAAQLMGKEAGLLVTSGSQGNLIAILVHTRRGTEAIVGDRSHIYNAEVGSAAVVAGVQLRPVTNTERGTLDLRQTEAAIHEEDVHFAPTALICVENTHNFCGGAVLTVEDMADVRRIANSASLKVHLDGARIFNAAVALGIPARSLTAEADSVSFCLSKGLSAPVGSVLCGSATFIDSARSYRKMLGGGMRQAGVIAGPGIVALNEGIERLTEDHVNARRLGEALADLPGVHLNLDGLKTNIVIANISETGWTSKTLADTLSRKGVLCAGVGPDEIRFVTHRNVSSLDIDAAIDAITATIRSEHLNSNTEQEVQAAR